MMFYHQGAAAAANQDQEQSSPAKHQPSPVKGVMAALSKHRTSQEPLTDLIHKKTPAKIAGLEVPTTIEDVPFRRQDRRILNGRKKRMIARRVIRFGITIAIVLVLLGAGLLTSYLYYREDPDYWYVNPFLFIGIMAIVCGVMFGAFTIETCVGLRGNLARVQDTEIDTIKNLHLIKHWVEPELIPFGWGHNDSGDSNFAAGGTDAHAAGMINDSHEVVVDRATLKDDDVYAGNPHAILEIMQEDMMNNEDHDSIPKDIFDESLRYSGVDRPSLSISKSSPLNQRRGSFEDHGEKIANLFKM